MKITECTTQELASVYPFMKPIWEETYGEILPKAQIHFLLDKYFSETGLKHYRALGYQYYKIDDFGFLVFLEREKDVYLDKLYLAPKARGKNYPPQIFNWLLSRFGKDITLNVNQANTRALKCYLKNGFTVESKTDIDLGGGMINSDYVLRKSAK